MAAAYLHAVLLNPDSGPGQEQEQTFVDVVRSSQTAGLKVLGYVDSAYGTRSLQEMAQEFSTYSVWYEVDGFFIDDMYSSGKALVVLRLTAALLYTEHGTWLCR